MVESQRVAETHTQFFWDTIRNMDLLVLRLRLHEQIKHGLFAQICPELLHTDREFEQLKQVLFAHVNAALILYWVF